MRLGVPERGEMGPVSSFALVFASVLRSCLYSRKKDEEANRFTRHEVKNCVLAAIAQCESLISFHVKHTQVG